MTRRLLVLACSATKREVGEGETLPARELYDGPAWRVLRAHVRRFGDVGFRGVRVLALSAEHGLVDADAELATYDRRMDRRRAVVLEPRVREQLLELTRDADRWPTVDEVFVVAGAVYLPAIATALAALEQAGVDVTVAAGGIGYKLGALRVWLESTLEPELGIGPGTIRPPADELEPVQLEGRAAELQAMATALARREAGLPHDAELLEQLPLEREADRQRRELADDPFVTPAEYGELVEQADVADQAAALELEVAEADGAAGGQPLEVPRGDRDDRGGVFELERGIDVSRPRLVLDGDQVVAVEHGRPCPLCDVHVPAGMTHLCPAGPLRYTVPARDDCGRDVDPWAGIELDAEQRQQLETLAVDLSRAYPVAFDEVLDRLRAALPAESPVDVLRSWLAAGDAAAAAIDLARLAAAELGICCNHRCRRFEYVVAVVGDVEQARCPECEQLLVHESGLTWKDAAAAGYRGGRSAPTTKEDRNRA